jgi:phosphoserine phosphatase RsbU/P
MRILIAEDDDVSRLALEAMLVKRGHEVIPACDGMEALEALQGEDRPPLAILDWMMPERDGVEVCRRVRQDPKLKGLYLILLTSRGDKEHIVEGLRAGANDYVTKPFDNEELLARVNVAVEMLRLQSELAARVRELEDALANLKQLQGLLPICSYCKSIRDDHNYWQSVEAYLKGHSEAKLSHSVCPVCWENVVKVQLAKEGIQLCEYPHPTTPPQKRNGTTG